MSHIHLVINKYAGQYSKICVESIINRLQEAGHTVNIYYPNSSEDTINTSNAICNRYSSPIIVSVGGDGTLNSVVNGVNENAQIATIPAGTVNLLAKELAIDSVDTAIDKILDGKSKKIHLHTVECDGISKKFLLMVGVGFDGRVVNKTSQKLKRYTGKFAYAVSLLFCLPFFEKELMEIACGSKIYKCTSVVFCNCRYYAGNYSLSKTASVLKDCLDVVLVKADSGMKMLALLTNIALSRDNSHIISFECASLTVSNSKRHIQVDGDYLGYGSFRIIPKTSSVSIIS